MKEILGKMSGQAFSVMKYCYNYTILDNSKVVLDLKTWIPK